jgi:hypothetical protein
MIELQLRINKMLLSSRANVTGTPAQLIGLFSITDEIRNQVKTIILTNFSTQNIYFGVSASSSTSNTGGVIFPSQKMEVALVDLNYSPFFVSATSASLGIEVWG